MMRPEIRKKDNPEERLQDEFRGFLAVRDWVTMRTHGNRLQSGFPDLYALHHNYGARWIEMKIVPGGTITRAQHTVFPKLNAGHGVWMITKCNELEYAKLMRKPNYPGFVISPDVYIQGSAPEALRHRVKGQNPEAILQNNIMDTMRERGWICLPTLGNLYQHGFPDFYAYHPEFGAKWVEVKREEAYRFTGAQQKYFPLISQTGHGIWILTSVNGIAMLESKPAVRPNWPRYMYRD